MTQLIKYEAACRALAACKAVDEVKDLMDKAEAMRLYGRMAKDKTLETDAAEIRIRAERRLGQMIAQQKETVGLNHGTRVSGGKTPAVVTDDHRPKLADVGISKDLSSRAQRLAAVPDETFENEVGQWRDRVQAEGARVTTRLEKAGEKALKEDLIIVDECHNIESDEAVIERLSREKMELLDRLEVLLSDDLAKKLNDQQTEIYGLRGRVQQMLGENKANSDKLNYFSDLLHKLRKIYGVSTHAEILAAAQSQVV